MQAKLAHQQVSNSNVALADIQHIRSETEGTKMLKLWILGSLEGNGLLSEDYKQHQYCYLRYWDMGGLFLLIDLIFIPIVERISFLKTN